MHRVNSGCLRVAELAHKDFFNQTVTQPSSLAMINFASMERPELGPREDRTLLDSAAIDCAARIRPKFGRLGAMMRWRLAENKMAGDRGWWGPCTDFCGQGSNWLQSREGQSSTKMRHTAHQ